VLLFWDTVYIDHHWQVHTEFHSKNLFLVSPSGDLLQSTVRGWFVRSFVSVLRHARNTFSIGSRAAIFRRRLLSVDVYVYVLVCVCVRVSVCVSVCPQLCCYIYRKVSNLGGSCTIGTYGKVPMARRLVSSSMTSRDSDVILVTSQS